MGNKDPHNIESSRSPILVEAIKKRDAAQADVDHWSRFISDFEALSTGITGNGKTTSLKGDKPEKQGMPWAEMRQLLIHIREIKGSPIENAATFVSELARLGYDESKENVSSCLTNSRKVFAYNKDEGGWDYSAQFKKETSVLEQLRGAA